MNTISVAMATYNGARFIREQLDSIAAQTLLPAELVVTDDASSDETVAIVEDFARSASFPVHVHRNAERLGYRANFMHNVGLCSGSLIALCDQDDVWEAGKLAALAAPFADPEVQLAFHEAWLTDAAGARTGLAEIYVMPPVNPPLSLFPMRNPFGFAMMFRRRLLDFAALWDRSVDNLEGSNRMAHDQWFFFLASVFGTIVYLDAPLAGYRQHGNNTYGVGQRARTTRERFAAWVNQAVVEQASFGPAALARAAILDAVAPRLDAAWAERARVASDAYRTLARHSTMRSQVYRTDGVVGRLRGWAGMVADGVYGRRHRWALGRKGLLNDLVYLALPSGIGRALLPPARPASATQRNDVPHRASSTP